MVRLPGTLRLVAVGKLKTAHWRAAQADYAKRIQRYTRLEIVEVRDWVGSRNIADSVALTREGDALLTGAGDTPWTVALDVTGKTLDSPGFAAYIQDRVEVFRDVAFLIGGPLGLAPEVITSCKDRLSLSALTFPHELARVVLLEQIYRAMTILGGEQYHK